MKLIATLLTTAVLLAGCSDGQRTQQRTERTATTADRVGECIRRWNESGNEYQRQFAANRATLEGIAQVDWEVDACRIRVDFPNHRYALSYDALENPDDGGKFMVDSLPEGFVELRHDADVEDDGTLSAS